MLDDGLIIARLGQSLPDQELKFAQLVAAPANVYQIVVLDLDRRAVVAAGSPFQSFEALDRCWMLDHGEPRTLLK